MMVTAQLQKNRNERGEGKVERLENNLKRERDEPTGRGLLKKISGKMDERNKKERWRRTERGRRRVGFCED